MSFQNVNGEIYSLDKKSYSFVLVTFFTFITILFFVTIWVYFSNRDNIFGIKYFSPIDDKGIGEESIKKIIPHKTLLKISALNELSEYIKPGNYSRDQFRFTSTTGEKMRLFGFEEKNGYKIYSYPLTSKKAKYKYIKVKDNIYARLIEIKREDDNFK